MGPWGLHQRPCLVFSHVVVGPALATDMGLAWRATAEQKPHACMVPPFHPSTVTPRSSGAQPPGRLAARMRLSLRFLWVAVSRGEFCYAA